jgi:hypothetical protein
VDGQPRGLIRPVAFFRSADLFAASHQNALRRRLILRAGTLFWQAGTKHPQPSASTLTNKRCLSKNSFFLLISVIAVAKQHHRCDRMSQKNGIFDVEQTTNRQPKVNKIVIEQCF